MVFSWPPPDRRRRVLWRPVSLVAASVRDGMMVLCDDRGGVVFDPAFSSATEYRPVSYEKVRVCGSLVIAAAGTATFPRPLGCCGGAIGLVQLAEDAIAGMTSPGGAAEMAMRGFQARTASSR